MQFLLPHRFKLIGAFLIPAGLSLWILMQKKLVLWLLEKMIGKPDYYYGSVNYFINVATAVVGVFSFFIGLYFLAFSKEKSEDEMVKALRMQSIQFAAVIQFFILTASLVLMLVVGEERKDTMLLFLLGLIVMFWLTFIFRFNYLLHIKYRN